MFVKPKDGRSVRCPVKGIPLPKDGAEVPTIRSGIVASVTVMLSG